MTEGIQWAAVIKETGEKAIVELRVIGDNLGAVRDLLALMSRQLEEPRVAANTDLGLEVVMRLIEKDPHQWSARPCQTCRAISAVAGRPFGCDRKKP